MVIVSMTSSCGKHPFDNGIFIRNNSNQTIYYWYAHWIYDKDYKNYHYPDTILPIKKPNNMAIWSISPGKISHIERTSRIPDWGKIISELPGSTFSVYFFTKYPETQEEWDLIRESYNFYRKDITYEEVMKDVEKDRGYTINYP